MVFGSKFGFWAIFALVQFVRSDTVFSSQFLGNYVTNQEYESLEKCRTPICLLDADRLIYAATRNGSIKPCDDFKTFSMGEFYLHRKKNDRYTFIGFKWGVKGLLFERYRNALKESIHSDESKIFKVMKSYFNKCTDTDHVRKHGVEEIKSYLNSLGGSSLIADGTWDETKFDFAKLLELDPKALIFLTVHGISRCEVPSEDPGQVKRESICLTKQPRPRNDKSGLMKILKRLKFEKSKQEKAIDDYEEFLKVMISPYDSDVNYMSNTKLMRVGDLSAAFPYLKINWLKIINNRLFSTSQVTEDEEIFIEYPEFLNQTLMLLSTMDKGVIANAFTAQFLLVRTAFVFTHFLTTENAETYGSKQSYQRFQTCVEVLRESYLKLALASLLAKIKFNKEIQDAAEEFVVEVVDYYANAIDQEETLSYEEELTKHEVILKLRNVQLQVMFLDEMLNDSIIEKLYAEVNFDDTMTFIELQLAMESYYLKAHNERESSWVKALDRKNDENVRYLVEENILVVPAALTLSPYFVANRPRFFNVATLFMSVYAGLSLGLEEYLTGKNKSNVSFMELVALSNIIPFADKYYVDWEENGGKELHLSSFRLTNRQMLWLSIAHVLAFQYQKKKTESLFPLATLETDFFHLSYKKQKGFREAFQCGELTRQEKEMLSEFQRKKNLLKY